jgi:hypothetical protein
MTTIMYYADSGRTLLDYYNDHPVPGTAKFPEIDTVPGPGHSRVPCMLSDKEQVEAAHGLSGLTMITCSEIFLLYQLREVARGKTEPCELQIHWVFPKKEGCAWKTKRLEVDEDGEFLEQWPNGFFDERNEIIFDESFDFDKDMTAFQRRRDERMQREEAQRQADKEEAIQLALQLPTPAALSRSGRGDRGFTVELLCADGSKERLCYSFSYENLWAIALLSIRAKMEAIRDVS